MSDAAIPRSSALPTSPTPGTPRLAVIGLGYVGLPVALAFAEAGLPTLGFDIDPTRVAELQGGLDRTREIAPDRLARAGLRCSADPADLDRADHFIITVPTPITGTRRPDLSAVEAAARTVGAALRPGGLVVVESTLYPGAVREAILPILERESGLALGDFALGYSPERINPGDTAHPFHAIAKVVSGHDEAACARVAALYARVVQAGIHQAPSIEAAEAAKVIENTQRDLNIALMNELALICHRIGLDTHDVLAAARTKWNFLPFVPGLVGGHCIGVDPYYLTHRAEQVGYHPEVILAGRRVNDAMGAFVAGETVKRLLARGHGPGTRVTVLGATFKEDVPDIRNARVFDLVDELERFGMAVQLADPIADGGEIKRLTGRTALAIEALAPAAAVVLAVPHATFMAEGWTLMTRLLEGGTGLAVDVKARLERSQRPEGIELWRL